MVTDPQSEQRPIEMILYCPQCGLQHIDVADPAAGWSNPPHKTHLCLGCDHLWRPAQIPTVGVKELTGE